MSGKECGEGHIEAGETCHKDDPEVTKIVDRNLSRTWMKDLPENPEHRNLTDRELDDQYRAYPHTINGLKDSEKADLAALHREKVRRWAVGRVAGQKEVKGSYVVFEQKGKWPNGNPFPKEGDTVTAMYPGFGGQPYPVNGIATKRKSGLWIVKVTSQEVGGAKQTPLTQKWKIAKKQFNPGSTTNV